VRKGKDNGERFNQDEVAVLNLGFRNHQEIEEAEGANLPRTVQASRRTSFAKGQPSLPVHPMHRYRPSLTMSALSSVFRADKSLHSKGVFRVCVRLTSSSTTTARS
jgi:hypothetical protein